MSLPPLSQVGKILAVHGTKGFLSVQIDSNVHPLLTAGVFVFIEIDGFPVPFEIEEFNAKSELLKFTDISQRNDAESIIQNPIYFPEKNLSHIENMDWNLKGFELFNQNTKKTNYIGQIESIEHFPAGNMLIVINKKNKEIMIPWVENWIVEFDAQKSILVLDLPEGIVDL